MDHEHDAHGERRRRFLHICIGGMSAAAAGAIAYPLVCFMGLPRHVGKAKPIEVSLKDLSEDDVQYFEREGMQIVLVFTHREPKVFDAACTHLGCLVAWDPNDHVFRCPCHGAVFDDSGQVVSGPVNEPLRTVHFEVKNDTLTIA